MQTIGVIADTHIPDRSRNLPQAALDIFENAKVSGILHAGDISIPKVLDQLSEIAPTQAVKGNRDLFFGGNLPSSRIINTDNVNIGMSHGHGTLSEYLIEKARFIFRGPGSFKIIEERMLRLFPIADVIIFGHSHAPLNRKEKNGQLLFNPGSPTFPNEFISNLLPSVGLIHIESGNITAEIVHMGKNSKD